MSCLCLPDKQIVEIKANVCIPCAVQVRTVREGSEEAELFFHLLLDEPDATVGACLHALTGL